MHINWQKTLLITLDVALATYLGFAFTKFNKPDEKGMLCTKVNINIEDEMTNGFLNAKEIKKRLEIKKQELRSGTASMFLLISMDLFL